MSAEAKQLDVEIYDSNNTVMELSALFAQAIKNISGVDVDAAGHFVVRRGLPLREMQLLADANSQLEELLEKSFKDYLHSLNMVHRSEVATDFRAKYNGNKVKLLQDLAGLPDLSKLFEIVRDKPDLKLVD